MDVLEGLLSSKSRAKIFETLFDGSEKETYLRELERTSNLSTASIRFEMKNLIDLDLITTKKDGNRLYYKANDLHPLYAIIKQLIYQTRGPHLILGKTFEKNKKVELAFIFGSYAKNELMAHSDIDLFIVGTIKNMELSDIIHDLQLNIGREVNYHKYSKSEIKKKTDGKNHFLNSLKNEKKIFLKGSQDEFKRLFK